MRSGAQSWRAVDPVATGAVRPAIVRTPKTVERIRALRRIGWSAPRIAEAIGCSDETVYRALRKGAAGGTRTRIEKAQNVAGMMVELASYLTRNEAELVRDAVECRLAILNQNRCEAMGQRKSRGQCHREGEYDGYTGRILCAEHANNPFRLEFAA